MTVIAKGYDFSYGRPSPEALKANGAKFVVRYLSTINHSTEGKVLTQAEAQQYQRAGLEIVSNFEFYRSRCLEGRDAGVADAKTASAQHKAAGGPATRPIYFSVDVDTTASNYRAIDAYFDGVASVIGLSRTGVYGEYDVVGHLLDRGLVRYAWQTYAWSHGLYDERCQLAQDHNGLKIDKAPVDLDTTHALDYGQWGFNGAAPAAPMPTPRLASRTTVASPPAGTVYIVQRGDTLTGIAARYGTTVALIAAANQIANPNRIITGQRLVITGANPSAAARPVYVVQRGENLTGIAAKFGTTVEKIATVNHIKDPNKIVVGQRLVIPS